MWKSLLYVEKIHFFCLFLLFCVYRSVWRCCAVTVNRTLRGGISVIALFMTWQLMTAKICLKTSVSSCLCLLCVCVFGWALCAKKTAPDLNLADLLFRFISLCTSEPHYTYRGTRFCSVGHNFYWCSWGKIHKLVESKPPAYSQTKCKQAAI